ncbi:MAG: hypothetical protein Q9199_002721 [Rusavskia elegans]
MDYDGDKVDKGYSTANIVKREPDDYKLLNENPGHKQTGRPWIGALVQLHTLFPPYTKRHPSARTSWPEQMVMEEGEESTLISLPELWVGSEYRVAANNETAN